MTNEANQHGDRPDAARRAVLQAASAIVASGLGIAAGPVSAAEPGPRGKAGDFNFLAGNWKIAHRRLKGKEWDTFQGEATCWTILAGAGSIEELRIPARDFSGLGIRLLDAGQGVWCDYWVNGRDRVLSVPGTTGAFVNGVGTFAADDVDDGKPIKVRGVWDRITANSCRWYQAVSRDGGKTWQENWVMEWVRA